MAKAVYYSGTVQGVGFRASTLRIARRHAVRGWVRNLPNGRVEVFADGSPDEVEAFLSDIRHRMSGYIDNEEIQERATDPSLTDFRISY